MSLAASLNQGNSLEVGGDPYSSRDLKGPYSFNVATAMLRARRNDRPTN